MQVGADLVTSKETDQYFLVSASLYLSLWAVLSVESSCLSGWMNTVNIRPISHHLIQANPKTKSPWVSQQRSLLSINRVWNETISQSGKIESHKESRDVPRQFTANVIIRSREVGVFHRTTTHREWILQGLNVTWRALLSCLIGHTRRTVAEQSRRCSCV